MDSCPVTSSCHYITGITNRFTLPTDSGGVAAVAISSKHFSLVHSTYTLLSAIIIILGWNLLVAVIAAFSPADPSSSRYVYLVVFWNSNGPAGAALMILEYYKRVLTQRWGKRKSQDLESLSPQDRHEKNPQHNQALSSEGSGLDGSGKYTQEQETNGGQQPKEGAAGSGAGGKKARVRDLQWGALFLFLSVTMWISRLVAGLFITSTLWIGYSAPVDPNYVSYPDPEILSQNYTDSERFWSLKAPSALRALGGIESSNSTAVGRVHIERLAPPEGQTTSLWAGLNYDYNVTGVDMGLQSDPKLTLMVKGSCHTDYTWLVNSTDIYDTYQPWGGNYTYEVNHNEVSNIGPVAYFLVGMSQNSPTDELLSNISYAVIVSTAGRYSNTSSQDPWYATGGPRTNDTYPYKVLPKRPALSCWETKRWRLGGEEVEHTRLGELPGLKLHRFWIDKVFRQEYQSPRVATLGNIVGLSALKSSSFGSSLYVIRSSYVLDAGSSGVLDDLERLVWASWVSDGNVLYDTTTYDLGDMKNSARRPDGSVDPSVGGFVIKSDDVSTFSVKVLISVPATLVSLFLARHLFTAWAKHKGLITVPLIHELIDKTRTK